MMSTSAMSLAVSTWTFQKLLGSPQITGPNDATLPSLSDDRWPRLLTELRDFGMTGSDFCHFHLSSREPSFVDDLGAQFREFGITLNAFLIDGGNMAAADDDDFIWIQSWLPDAARLGCRSVRVIGGIEPYSKEGYQRSVARFRQLVPVAQEHGLAVITENFHPLLNEADTILRFLDDLAGKVGFLVDLGNLPSSGKYEALEALAPHSLACHAKADMTPNGPDTADMHQCLEIMHKHGFAGPIALIGAEADFAPWTHLIWMKTQVEQVFSGVA